MKKVLIQTILLLIGGYAVLALIGWIMSLDIPVPVSIIGFCLLMYKTLRKEIER